MRLNREGVVNNLNIECDADHAFSVHSCQRTVVMPPPASDPPPHGVKGTTGNEEQVDFRECNRRPFGERFPCSKGTADKIRRGDGFPKQEGSRWSNNGKKKSLIWTSMRPWESVGQQIRFVRQWMKKSDYPGFRPFFEPGKVTNNPLGVAQSLLGGKSTQSIPDF